MKTKLAKIASVTLAGLFSFLLLFNCAYATSEEAVIQPDEFAEIQSELNGKLTNSFDDNSEYTDSELEEALPDLIKQSLPIIIVGSIGIVVMLLMIKKSSKSVKQSYGDEIRSYLKPVEVHTYTGFITVTLQGVTYSRNGRGVTFDIPIDKETILAPFMVDPWFENRNYNGREANMILADIEKYLKDNKICRKVTIVSDEEYEAMCIEQETE